MKPWQHNRKLLIGMGILISFVAVFYSANTGFAAVTSFKDIGTSLIGLGGTVATLILTGAVARMLAGVLLTYAANILDFAFEWNTQNIFTNLLSGGPINLFWGYARDIVNGLLILILLWIAFGIIFSLERFNARRLLVRVILIGLLINFSLTFTSSVFAFANALAQPFAEQLKKAGGPEIDPKTKRQAINPDTGKLVYRGISVKIIEITNLHTVMNAAGKDVSRIKSLAEQQQAAQAPILTPEEKAAAESIETFEGPPTQTFTSNPVPQEVSQNTQTLPGVGEAEAAVFLAPILWGAAKLAGGAIAYSGITTFLEQFALGSTDAGPIGVISAGAFKLFLNPFIGALFLLVATFVIGSLAIVFIARGVIIMILAILSPLAFLAVVIPGQDKYFKMWLGKLINWSFFAPLSFFLLLFAMHVGDKLQEFTAAQAKGVELQAALPAVFQYALILALLISALAIAKYMGVQLAATLMSFGEKQARKGLGFARGLAVGTVRKAVLSPLAQASGKLEEGLGKAPVGVQRLFGLPAAGLRRVTAVGRKEVGEARKQFSQMKPEEIQRAIAQGTFLTQADRTAAVLELAARKRLAPLPGAEGYEREGPKAMRDAVDRLLRMGGDYMDILKANPTIAELKDLKLTPGSIDETRLFNNLRALPGFEGFSGEQVRTNEQLSNIAAQLKVWEKVDPGDLSKIDAGIFKDEKTITLPNNLQLRQDNLSKELFIKIAKPEHYSRIMRDDPDTGTAVNAYFQSTRGKELAKEMEAGTYYFFGTPSARAQGWNLPPDAVSVKALEQDLRNIQEQISRLGARAQALRARFPDPAAENRHRRVMGRLAELHAEQTDTNDRLRRLQQPRQAPPPPGPTPPPPPAGAPTP